MKEKRRDSSCRLQVEVSVLPSCCVFAQLGFKLPTPIKLALMLAPRNILSGRRW